MQEEERRTDVTPTKEDAERDATSKETVSDLEESGGAVDTNRSETSTGSDAPSPDGQFDNPRGGTEPGNETDPM